MTTDVALVGMAFRFPGATEPETFWSNLRDGVESITRFSAAELIAAGTPPSLLERPGFVAARGILASVAGTSTPPSSTSPRARRRSWTRSTASCWSAPGRRSSGPATIRTAIPERSASTPG